MTTRPFQSALVAACLSLGAFGLYNAGANSRQMAPAAAVVATVDMEKLMQGLSEVKSRNEVIQIDTTAKQKTLDEMGERLKKLKGDLDVLNKESIEYRNKLAEAIELEEHAQSTRKIYKQLIELDSGELIRAVYTKVRAAVAKVAEKDGYSLVILDDRGIELPKTGSDQEMNGRILNKRIMYAAPALDITDRVMTEMNNEFAVPAPKK